MIAFYSFDFLERIVHWKELAQYSKEFLINFDFSCSLNSGLNLSIFRCLFTFLLIVTGHHGKLFLVCGTVRATLTHTRVLYLLKMPSDEELRDKLCSRPIGI